ncbi:MAG: toll/interleukin-1 receptor domain-containing protein [Ruminococcus sp.]|nr:toll/interleukin-1 receptor domain-containing protein [Ruminococcus sp.]
MAVFKCKMCGGTLNAADGINVCQCEYCGTTQTLPKSRDDITTNLFNRANSLRLSSEFDKALETYEKIVNTAPDDSEAYWGMVLCKYGIEYVDDPATRRKVPTCHRTLLESIMADVDYKSALSYADSESRRLYSQEAAEIDRLQRNILDIARRESPFDVFICYKETDEHGRRTQDSVIANDIYHQLRQEGFKVFYAAITLEDKLGTEYEPYIFSALQSAKVMLVIGTKPEYYTSPWMKNEWSRYLRLMKADRRRILIPCYRDMDAYDLPEEFSHLQAQDMSRIGFINDIIRGIRKIITGGSTVYEHSSAEDRSPASQNLDPEKMLQRIEIFLSDKDFENASRYCERVLDNDPECAQAYFFKFLAENSCSTPEELYRPKAITFFATRYISGYGFKTDNEEIFRTRINYVLGHSMKNALAFSKGNEHDEIEHVYEGVVSIVRNDIAQRERKLEEQEQQIVMAAYERQQANVQKLEKKVGRKRIKGILLLLAIISLFIALGLFSDDNSSGALFIVFFIGLLISSIIA